MLSSHSELVTGVLVVLGGGILGFIESRWGPGRPLLAVFSWSCALLAAAGPNVLT